ncbi:hypothetical protein LT104_13895 [Lacticaseibacillus zeae]|uniref:hypothetical protein n=1 Tax=Lacticaseibacillus zeae TaxID=57037 RepID=UPI00237EF92B|nr:hypothetical protein [Lacticaseibacillus zeae]MDE3316994.1 hypothetical protein [Lacticaseibacillus zeae]
MAFVELEHGEWINPAFIKEIYKRNPGDTVWEALMNHGEATPITDADRIQILKTAGFVKIKKEKNDE